MLTTIFKNHMIRYLFSRQSNMIPATFYLGVSTTDPAISVTEPVGNGYQRKSFTNSIATFSKGDDDVTTTITNTRPVTLNASSGSWGVVTHYVIFDKATDGTLLIYGALPAPADTVAGTTFSIPIDGLVATLEERAPLV